MGSLPINQTTPAIQTHSTGVLESRSRVAKVVIHIALLSISVTMILPFLWMVSSSLKLETQVFALPMRWIPTPIRFSNYLEVWQRAPFARYYFNTVILTFLTVTTQLFTSSLTGYVFARLSFPERDKIFFVYLGTLMVPYMVIMIPQFVIVRTLGLYDTLWAVYLINAFSPFGTFLFRQFFLTIPFELSESARIDGCSEFLIYRKIIMPLSLPAIATLTVFFFNFTWNDFLGPLIYLPSDHNKTIQVGVRSFITLYNQDYALLMAAAVLAMLPILALYLFIQKFFIEGIAMTGIKG